MFRAIKERLYFVAAWYFRFWASVSLGHWDPRIIVVTGSSGKTTLLHMLEAQLGDQAHYSHHANSAFGIPFDILGLKGVEGSRWRWLHLFAHAPLRAVQRNHGEEFYVAEVDAERPGEAPFLGRLLRPEVTLWVSSARTHGRFFERSVAAGRFGSVEEAIAHEYAELCRQTTKLVLIDGDNELMVKALANLPAELQLVKQAADLKDYQLTTTGTNFELSNGHHYVIGEAQPRAVFYQVAFADRLLDYLQVQPDFNFSKLQLPPGRSSVFQGIKNTTIIDSSYNANLSSMQVVLDMFKEYPGEHKWLVIGDMLEQGEGEAEEHEKLAELVAGVPTDRVILLGPRVSKYTLPRLQALLKERPLVAYENPKDVLTYLEQELQGGETILFKGARFLEGVIEHLLADPADAAKLARREAVWQKRRAAWGL